MKCRDRFRPLEFALTSVPFQAVGIPISAQGWKRVDLLEKDHFPPSTRLAIALSSFEDLVPPPSLLLLLLLLGQFPHFSFFPIEVLPLPRWTNSPL